MLTALHRNLWNDDFGQLQPPRRWLIGGMRVAVLAYEGFFRCALPTRAASLAYTTIFSLVPTLAVGFAVFDAVGGIESARTVLLPKLIDYLAVGVRDEARVRIEEALNNLDTGAAGAVGSVFLVIAALSLLNSIENAFNEVWGVEKTRGYTQRVLIYWAVLSLTPLLLVGGLSLQVAAAGYPPLHQVFETVTGLEVLLASILPLFLICGGFTLMYWFLVSARIPFRAAVISGTSGGVLWWTAVQGYTAYVRHSFYYSAVYGPLGAVLVFLFWLYLSWLLVLIGGLIGYATENLSAFRQERLARNASQRAHEILALAVLAEVASRFEARAPCFGRDQLAEALRASSHLVNHTISRLVRCGFLREVRESGEVVPAVSLEATPVVEVLSRLRNEGNSIVLGSDVSGLEEIERLWDENEAEAWARQKLSVAELARGLSQRVLPFEPGA